jgi:hypothetical protein
MSQSQFAALHEGKHELTPWMNFLLAVIRRGFAEFESRAGQIKAPRGAKTALVEQAINSFPGQFSIAEIERICPGGGGEPRYAPACSQPFAAATTDQLCAAWS